MFQSISPDCELYCAFPIGLSKKSTFKSFSLLNKVISTNRFEILFRSLGGTPLVLTITFLGTKPAFS